MGQAFFGLDELQPSIWNEKDKNQPGICWI